MLSALDWIRLTNVPGVGLSSYWRLVDYFRHPSRVLSASRGELQKTGFLQEGQIEALVTEDSKERSREELARLEQAGGRAICYEAADYPVLLKQLVDPPPVLYALGRYSLLENCCVAMVGSRAATGYGRRVAFSLSRDLSQYPVTVVSGLALGIDAASHRGILEGNGATVAVLGCGLDVVYPYQNRQIYGEIARRGLIISEYPLGTPPDSFRFPARNRIIAGLSKGVVVIEAARKSGSLITAQIALDYGREVFAVPGQVDSRKSEGTHWLLKQGARLVQSVGDIAEELRLEKLERGAGSQGRVARAHLEIDPEAVKLLDTIECYPQSREKVVERAGLSSARVSELLLFLELEGLIELLPGDMLCRVAVNAGK
jgi:DNA processing protein